MIIILNQIRDLVSCQGHLVQEMLWNLLDVVIQSYQNRVDKGQVAKYTTLSLYLFKLGMHISDQIVNINKWYAKFRFTVLLIIIDSVRKRFT